MHISGKTHGTKMLYINMFNELIEKLNRYTIFGEHALNLEIFKFFKFFWVAMAPILGEE